MKTSVGVAVVVLLWAATLTAQPCEERVHFVIDEGTMEVRHEQALYNCCAWLGFEVYQDGPTIDIIEWEHLDPPGGCSCVCCFDVSIVIGGLDPGDYSVSISKRMDDGETVLLGPWSVTVDGACEPVLLTTYVPCVATSIEDPTETSWGKIKSQYR